MLWCVVETSCGWADPQAIWKTVHMSWYFFYFLYKGLCFSSAAASFTLDWKIINPSSESAGHMKNVTPDSLQHLHFWLEVFHVHAQHSLSRVDWSEVKWIHPHIHIDSSYLWRFITLSLKGAMLTKMANPTAQPRRTPLKFTFKVWWS